MYENIVGGLVSGIVLWLLKKLWQEEGFSSAKLILRIIFSAIFGFFIAGTTSALISSYTHEQINLKSFEAIGLLILGIAFSWYILSNFGWLKSLK